MTISQLLKICLNAEKLHKRFFTIETSSTLFKDFATYQYKREENSIIFFKDNITIQFHIMQNKEALLVLGWDLTYLKK